MPSNPIWIQSRIIRMQNAGLPAKFCLSPEPIALKELSLLLMPFVRTRFDHRNGMNTDEDLEYIGDYLNEIPHTPLISPKLIQNLQIADELLVRAVFLGANEDGLFKAKPKQ